MLLKIDAYIRKHKLLNPGAKVIAAVSGGADSVAMLHCLQQLGYDCIVAHCNFKLRGQESDSDALFVKQLATTLGLTFQQTDFNTEAYAHEQKISIEMAARDLRYNWFKTLRIEFNADAIAVAHHADDNVETLLMNLTRGTGLRGMTGIPVRNGSVVRPLLHCTRAEILEYLQTNKLNFVTDSTNAENEYIRNRFRNELIPTFETINPAFRLTITETIARFEEIETIYSEHIALEISKMCRIDKEKTYIDTSILKTKNYAKTILFELLSPCQFHIDTISNILKSLENSIGTIFYSPTHKLLCDRHQLVLTKLTEVLPESYTIYGYMNEINEPVKLRITHRKNDGTIQKAKHIATFDAAKLKFPLTLRHWQQADSFVPFGMQTHKKVSDFFIDNKINRFEKEAAWLLLSGTEIVWLVGRRTDNRFAVDNTTTKIIEIQLLN